MKLFKMGKSLNGYVCEAKAQHNVMPYILNIKYKILAEKLCHIQALAKR